MALPKRPSEPKRPAEGTKSDLTHSHGFVAVPDPTKFASEAVHGTEPAASTPFPFSATVTGITVGMTHVGASGASAEFIQGTGKAAVTGANLHVL